MKLKKIVSVVLAVVMLGSTSTVLASAKEAKDKTFNYVALGDSIAAGYGLEPNFNGSGIDKALMLNEELIADPVKDAYANVFGGYLDELAAEKGYVSETANLSMTAYRAEDVEKTILNPGYKGEIATYIFENMIGEGSSAVLIPYHDIAVKYLADADLVSIELGGNDILMGVLFPMLNSENPVLQASGISLAMMMIGLDAKSAAAVGVYILNNNKDKITVESVNEAVRYLSNIGNDSEALVQLAAANVGKVIDAVRTVNTDAEIAVVGMFNPFGSSLEYDGQVRDITTVLVNIFSKAVAESANVDLDDNDSEPAGDDSASPSNYFTERRKEWAKAMIAIIAQEISYPIQYQFAGKTVEPQVQKFNELLKGIAAEKGARFVDVYSISNEDNLDPHPGKQGHKEIADLLWAELSGDIAQSMTDSGEYEVLVGDVDGDGEVTVSDATQIQKYLAGIGTDESFDLDAADVDGDGEVTVADATIIQKFAAGFTEEVGNAGKTITVKSTEAA